MLVHGFDISEIPEAWSTYAWFLRQYTWLLRGAWMELLGEEEFRQRACAMALRPSIAYLYYHLVDKGDIEWLSRLFHPDISYNRAGQPIEGLDAFRAFYLGTGAQARNVVFQHKIITIMPVTNRSGGYLDWLVWGKYNWHHRETPEKKEWHFIDIHTFDPKTQTIIRRHTFLQEKEGVHIWETANHATFSLVYSDADMMVEEVHIQDEQKIPQNHKIRVTSKKSWRHTGFLSFEGMSWSEMIR